MGFKVAIVILLLSLIGAAKADLTCKLIVNSLKGKHTNLKIRSWFQHFEEKNLKGQTYTLPFWGVLVVVGFTQ